MPLLAERQIPRETAILIASSIGPMQVAGRIVLMLVEKRISSAMAAAIAFGGVTVASLILMAAGASRPHGLRVRHAAGRYIRPDQHFEARR